MRMLLFVALLLALWRLEAFVEAGQTAAPARREIKAPAKLSEPPFWLPGAERKLSIEEVFCFKSQDGSEGNLPMPEQEELKVKESKATAVRPMEASILAGQGMAIVFFLSGIGGWIALGISTLVLARRHSPEDHPSRSS